MLTWRLVGLNQQKNKQYILDFFFNSLDILNSEVEICGDFFLGKNNVMLSQNGLTISHTYIRCSLKLY